MKKYFKLVAFCLAVTLVAPLMTSCSDDDDDKEVVKADTAALNEELTACTALLEAATTTDYPQTAIDAFRQIVTAVKTGLEKNPSQTEVDNMLTQLQEAKAAFLASAYDALPTDKMVCAWDFEKEGDNLVSNGVKPWTAVLKAGPAEIFGTDTQKPLFVEGVKGGKALSFDKGAHLEISDYTKGDLLKDELSLSVWVKPTKTVAGNYIISLNYWNTFKFNLQDENKPFFTVATEQGIIDADNEMPQSVKENEWAHLVVVMSYKSHTLKFYVNGELTKTWDETGKPALASNTWAADYVSPTGKTLPLIIGASTTYEEAMAAWSDWFKPSVDAWDYFHGSMDQLKLFTVALTDGQVNKLFNDER